MTRLADRPDVTDHYDEKELSALLLSIAAINVWNRINTATRQPAASAW